jgi:hypothetical protein
MTFVIYGLIVFEGVGKFVSETLILLQAGLVSSTYGACERLSFVSVNPQARMSLTCGFLL